MGGVGLLELARPAVQEPQPVGGQGGPGGQHLHRRQVRPGEVADGPAQGQHPDGLALDHHRAPDLGVGPEDRPAGGGGAGGQLAVPRALAQMAGRAGSAPARPGGEAGPGSGAVARLEQEHALDRLQGPAGALQQGGSGRGQVLAARQDAERGQQLLAGARPPRSGHVFSSSCSSGSGH